MVIEIPLTQGFAALVDDEDAMGVRAVGHWSASDSDGHWYALHSYRDQFDVPRSIRLHTFLTGWSYIDHINGDGLDNRRANLRPATHSQNNANQRLNRANSTGYKGVHLYRRTGRYRAYIAGPNGRSRHLGYFPTAELAACAYDVAAVAQWGDYARTNFPVQLPPEVTS